MLKSWKIMLVLAILALALVGCSEDDDTVCPPGATVPDLTFAGSDKCAECHTDQHARWVESGHPYKLTKIDGVAPTESFPSFSGFPNDAIDPPAGYTWADISYTIGGYGWKMRWIDNEGYIITQNADTQYNFETQTRATYHGDDPIGTKKYNCGSCHTTGWELSDDGIAENNQDGLEGMVGTFFAGGIHCEECHGMGSRHASAPATFAMTIDRSSAECGRCHTRDAENRVAASGGFIKHHEQFDEWSHSPHNSEVGCNDCHDPHSSVKYDDVAMGTGTLTSCTDCHDGYDGAAGFKHNGMPGCTDCHMPKATKSAIFLSPYVGDIKTHIMNINPMPQGKTDGMFNEAGNLVAQDDGGQAYVTLDFACYSCHKDDAGVGGNFSQRTLQQLSDYVLGVGEYAGTGGIHSPTMKVIANN